MTAPILVCSPKPLPNHLQGPAAAMAVSINKLNAPPMGVQAAVRVITGNATGPPLPWHLAVLVDRKWGTGGVHLTVGFMETTQSDLANRILSHMNSWSQWANVKFTLAGSPSNAQVRITLKGDGYWSYLGTDVLSIPKNQPTMSLQDFSMDTEESEYHRVVRHETGHTLGCPHEHMRPELVALLDPAKTIAFFQTNYGWDAQTTTEQVLTPVSESSLIGTPHADALSIMCYQIDGSCTKSGQPIIGGIDIDPMDQAFIGSIYPLVVQPPPPPPPGPSDIKTKIDALFLQVESHLSGQALRLVKQLHAKIDSLFTTQQAPPGASATMLSGLNNKQILLVADGLFTGLELALRFADKDGLADEVRQLHSMVAQLLGTTV